jgi:hypothetical protein
MVNLIQIIVAVSSFPNLTELCLLVLEVIYTFIYIYTDTHACAQMTWHPHDGFRQRSLKKTYSRWENNIKVDLESRIWRC